MVALTLGVLAVAPSAAGAFVGESSVLNGAKTDLTGTAKSIITNPTFITENVGEAGVLGGTTESGAAAGVFESAGVLPVLGSVVSFGVGTVIGSEICGVLGIEGCWYFGSEGADPSISGGSWVADTKSIGGPFIAPEFSSYGWYWKPSCCSEHGAFVYRGLGGYDPSAPGGLIAPTSQTGNNLTTTLYEASTSNCKLTEGCRRAQPYRSYTQNRVFEYHAKDDPEIGNYSYTAPGNWSEKAATALKNQSGNPSARVGEKIASKIAGSGVSNPYAVTVTMPSCSGESWVECKVELEELHLVPERSTLTWETAHLDLAGDAVVSTNPASGASVETFSKAVVTTNPAEADMPLVVPEIAVGESYADYIKKLAPAWVPTQHELSPEFTDPHKGPGDVTRTSPEPGTRADPATEPAIDIFNNPTDAPPAAGTWTAPAIPSIDLSPLSGVSVGCNSFPFGVFCWVADGLTSWGAEGECPAFDVPFTSEIRDSTSDLTFDTCTFEPAMDIIRPMLVILSFFGVAWLLSASAMGLGGGASADD